MVVQHPLTLSGQYVCVCGHVCVFVCVHVCACVCACVFVYLDTDRCPIQSASLILFVFQSINIPSVSCLSNLAAIVYCYGIWSIGSNCIIVTTS